MAISGPYRPYLEHPTSQTAGRPAGADACVLGSGDRRHASTDAFLLSPPAPWHRPPGTPVFEPAACSSPGRYGPLAGKRFAAAGAPHDLVLDDREVGSRKRVDVALERERPMLG